MPTTINGQVMTAQELAAWAVDTGAFVLFDDRLAPAGLMDRRGIALTDVKSAPTTDNSVDFNISDSVSNAVTTISIKDDRRGNFKGGLKIAVIRANEGAVLSCKTMNTQQPRALSLRHFQIKVWRSKQGHDDTNIHWPCHLYHRLLCAGSFCLAP